MKFAFWKKDPSDDSDDSEDVSQYNESRAKRDGCRHDWTNWSDPHAATVPVYSMLGGSTGETQDTLVQNRQCLKCNMHERRRVA